MQTRLMNNFLAIFRRKETEELARYSIIKIYIMLDEHNWKLYIEKLVHVYETLLDGDAGRYWVNYSKTSPFNKEKFLRKIFGREFGDLENLVLTNEDSSISVDVNLISAVNSRMCEVRITLPSSADLKRLFSDLSADLIEIGTVLHGYARSLTVDCSPISENKIKKTFGGISVTVEPFNKTWFCVPSLQEDMMKGVYRLNLVRKTLLKDDYFGRDAKKKAIEMGQGLVIVECSSTDLQEIQDAGRDISKFVQTLS